MTKNVVVISLACVILALPGITAAQDASVPAAGLDWYPFEEAVDLAKQTKKKVLVDVYAAWCPWCRRLQSEVYTDEDVRSYVREHFVLTRLDAENQEDSLQFKEHKLTPADLAVGLGAQGFPTTVFLDEESDYITRLPGFIDAGEFHTVLGYIGSEAFVDQSFEEYSGRLKK
jgi:thioredoxin-related protein